MILPFTPRPIPNEERKLCQVRALTICTRPSLGPS
jgi:hypothetical protein